MRHLTEVSAEYLPSKQILANWLTTSTFIYSDDADTKDLKILLRYEVLSKSREMIVSRLTTRLISLMKEDLRDELKQDLVELNQKEESV